MPAEPKAVIGLDIYHFLMAKMEKISEIHNATVSGSNRWEAVLVSDKVNDCYGS